MAIQGVEGVEMLSTRFAHERSFQRVGYQMDLEIPSTVTGLVAEVAAVLVPVHVKFVPVIGVLGFIVPRPWAQVACVEDGGRVTRVRVTVGLES